MLLKENSLGHDLHTSNVDNLRPSIGTLANEVVVAWKIPRIYLSVYKNEWLKLLSFFVILVSVKPFSRISISACTRSQSVSAWFTSRSVFVFIFRALVQVFAPEELVHEDEHVSVLVAMRVRRAAGGAPHQRLAVVVADVVPSGLARRRCKKDNPVVISVELVSHLPPDFKLGAAVGVPRVRRVVEQAARAHGRDQPRVGVRLQMPEGAQ
ncbi:hypothetical protein MSG28_012927 [Choristoneura fumiferana]|uniref:Uncharacterized protein n=1 Tax=Choristoneura fumiferana TaxID=7141 RepID=A0ACC0KSB4_CHOFU|nr:hypothetical protein MSG28_012927 [Choristoneura fumiferana]